MIQFSNGFFRFFLKKNFFPFLRCHNLIEWYREKKIKHFFFPEWLSWSVSSSIPCLLLKDVTVSNWDLFRMDESILWKGNNHIKLIELQMNFSNFISFVSGLCMCLPSFLSKQVFCYSYFASHTTFFFIFINVQ